MERLLKQLESSDFFQDLVHFLGRAPRKVSLYLVAFTHKSFANEHGKLVDYEVLEFLGDSVLNFITSSEIYNRYGKVEGISEGQCSRLRSSIVNQETIADLSSHIKLEQGIYLGRGEILRKGNKNKPILCDVFEALIGAIYSDLGLSECKHFFLKLVRLHQKKTGIDLFDLKEKHIFDYKGHLQEMTLKQYKVLPEYVITQNNQTFEAKILICGVEVSCGVGASKKEAQKNAAYLFISSLENEQITLERKLYALNPSAPA